MAITGLKRFPLLFLFIVVGCSTFPGKGVEQEKEFRKTTARFEDCGFIYDSVDHGDGNIFVVTKTPTDSEYLIYDNVVYGPYQKVSPWPFKCYEDKPTFVVYDYKTNRSLLYWGYDILEENVIEWGRTDDLFVFLRLTDAGIELVDSSGTSLGLYPDYTNLVVQDNRVFLRLSYVGKWLKATSLIEPRENPILWFQIIYGPGLFSGGYYYVGINRIEKLIDSLDSYPTLGLDDRIEYLVINGKIVAEGKDIMPYTIKGELGYFACSEDGFALNTPYNKSFSHKGTIDGDFIVSGNSVYYTYEDGKSKYVLCKDGAIMRTMDDYPRILSVTEDGVLLEVSGEGFLRKKLIIGETDTESYDELCGILGIYDNQPLYACRTENTIYIRLWNEEIGKIEITEERNVLAVVNNKCDIYVLTEDINKYSIINIDTGDVYAEEKGILVNNFDATPDVNVSVIMFVKKIGSGIEITTYSFE